MKAPRFVSAISVLVCGALLAACPPPPPAAPGPGPAQGPPPPATGQLPPDPGTETVPAQPAGPPPPPPEHPQPPPEPPAPPPAPVAELAPDGASCDGGGDCQSGICEGQGCGPNTGVCVARSRPCTKDLRSYCGCDGTTFRGSGSCPGRRYAHRGECKDAEKRADGQPCATASQCASGICEGQGCGDAETGTCAPARRACTRDLRAYCGCDGQTFRTSGSCPGRRYQYRGACRAVR